DYASLAASDLDMQVLEAALPCWQRYEYTDPAQTLARMAGATVVLSNKVVLGEAHFAASPALRLVVIMATGTNNVDLAAARRHGVAVCNVAQYSTPSVVQYTFAALLGLRTRLPQYQQAVDRWPGSPFFGLLDYPIEEVAGSCLGIVGYGAIGQAVAQVGRALGMQVCIAESLSGRVGDMERLPLPVLLARVDALSLHCPLSERSRGLI